MRRKGRRLRKDTAKVKLGGRRDFQKRTTRIVLAVEAVRNRASSLANGFSNFFVRDPFAANVLPEACGEIQVQASSLGADDLWRVVDAGWQSHTLGKAS